MATMRKCSAITLITQKPLYSDLCNLVAVLHMETSYHGFHLKRMYQQYGSKAKKIMSFANNIAILVVANELHKTNKTYCVSLLIRLELKKICKFFR